MSGGPTYRSPVLMIASALALSELQVRRREQLNQVEPPSPQEAPDRDQAAHRLAQLEARFRDDAPAWDLPSSRDIASREPRDVKQSERIARQVAKAKANPFAASEKCLERIRAKQAAKPPASDRGRPVPPHRSGGGLYFPPSLSCILVDEGGR
jgi:hypothetical protein